MLRWLVAIVAGAIVGILLLPPVENASDRAKEDAFVGCKEILRENLPAIGERSSITFPSMASTDNTSGDEFYFAFRSGSIAGATRAKPDLVTNSMEPSASCIGSLSRREFTWITMNGTDLVDQPTRF